MYQEQPQQPNQGFAKRSKNRWLTDNKADEVMGNVLELYPNKKQYIFQGKEGATKRKELLKKVREKFNMACEEEPYSEFGKGKFRDKLKKAKKGLQKVGNAVKTATLAPARGAMLGLVRLNYRGSASRFNLLNSQGEKKLYDKWEKLGGKKDALQKAIDAGKSKKPFVCGKKCRAQAGKNPQLPSDAQSDFVNFEPATSAALIGAGGTVLTATIGVVSSKSNYKSQMELAKLEGDVNKEDDKEKKVDDAMTPQEKALAEEIVKAQEGSFDAVQAITNNPNLTAEEKTAALTELKNDLNEGGGFSNNLIMIAVGVIALVGVAFYLYKQNKN